MTSESTADSTLRRIAIDPLSRVEGHGRVTLLVDDNNRVQQARLHIVEFRGFEKFIQGRPHLELPILTQRLCGICPVSHHLAAAKAVDMIAGLRELPPTAEKLRRLLHFGQVLQSHATHFYHLAAPDLLFGFADAAGHRNIVGLIQEQPDIALRGIQLRKYGQELIRILTGKRVHGTFCLPGGVNKALSAQDRAVLRRDIDAAVEWTEAGVVLLEKLFFADEIYHRQFAAIDSKFLGLVDTRGALELYHGDLRLIDESGAKIHDVLDCTQYTNYIQEEVRDWTYMKFPFFSALGTEYGWYRVGPLARVNLCDSIATERAENYRLRFKQIGAGAPVQATLAYHWARAIEALHCAEAIRQLLDDPDIVGTELRSSNVPQPQREGIGVIEAPRGTLFHHYRVDDDGLVSKANLIVSTTSNNRAMNDSVRAVAARYFDGRDITEPMLNQIEVAIRAYDPCLSCATHAVGKMPLQLELRRMNGALLQSASRDSDGSFRRDDPTRETKQ